MSKSKSNVAAKSTLTAALHVIAHEFFAPVERKMKDGIEIVNSMQFTQNAVLKGICWTFESQRSFSVQAHRTAANKLQSLVRGGQGEVSDRQIQQQVEWMDRLETQIAVLDSVIERAVKVYEELSGSTYIPREIEIADRQKTKTLAAKGPDARVTAIEKLRKAGLSVDDGHERHDSASQTSDHSHRVSA